MALIQIVLIELNMSIVKSCGVLLYILDILCACKEGNMPSKY